MEIEFQCPGCNARLHSSARNIFGWAGVILAIPAMVITLDAPWWERIIALVAAAIVAVAIGVAFGTVSLHSEQDAT
jgi:hypothetical protein